jgi:hypothetical protein
MVEILAASPLPAHRSHSRLVIVAVFLGSNTALSDFVDSLWFGSLGTGRSPGKA